MPVKIDPNTGERMDDVQIDPNTGERVASSQGAAPPAPATPPQGILQRVFGKNPVSDTLDNIADHATNLVAGPYHALTDAPRTPEEAAEKGTGPDSGVVANALGQVGLGVARMAVNPTLEAARQAWKLRKQGGAQASLTAPSTYDAQGNNVPTAGSKLVDAIPVFGPWSRNYADEVHQKGFVPATAGLVTDAIAPEEGLNAAGKVARILPKVPTLAGRAADAATLAKDRFTQTTYPENLSLTTPEQAAQGLVKALVPDAPAIANIKGAAPELADARAYAQRVGLPENGKLDTAKALQGRAAEVQNHYDDTLLKPHAGKVQGVPQNYNGERFGSGEGSGQATMGQINDRVNTINQELKSNFRKKLASQTTEANASDADLLSEKSNLTNILHSKLADWNGLQPEDIASVRQRAGKLRTLAEEVGASADRDTVTAGRRDSSGGSLAVKNPLDAVIDKIGGGQEVIGNRIFKNAMDGFAPQENPLPQPNPMPMPAPATRTPLWQKMQQGSDTPPDASALQPSPTGSAPQTPSAAATPPDVSPAPDTAAQPTIQDRTIVPADPQRGVKPIALPVEVPGAPTHPLGAVTGIDHDSGLPIVKRGSPSAQDATPTPAPSSAQDAPPQVAADAPPVPPPDDAAPSPQPAPVPDVPAKLGTGSHVRLPTGEAAKFSYYNPEMERGRALTADGRFIPTLKGRDVTPITQAEFEAAKAGTPDAPPQTAPSDLRQPAAVEAGAGQPQPPQSQGLFDAPNTDRSGGDAGESVAPPAAAPAPTGGLNPGDAGRVPLSSLNVDPKRFQYKMNTDAHGATGKLKESQWNDTLAGSVDAWRDPADGKTYVVNGHHRYDLARRSGAPDMTVKMMPDSVKTAAQARSTGALQNIADGNGTATDAAKFMRASEYSPEAMKNFGISMSGPLADGGAALARLSPDLFDKVASGRIPENRGISIGKAAETPEQQEALVKLIGKAEAKGKSVTNETIDELGRMVKGSDVLSTQHASLFGPEMRTQSTALEKAEVSAYVRKQLLTEKKMFGSLTNKSKAEVLASKAGNVIDTEANQQVATSAAQGQEVYDRLSTRSGPIDAILNTAAKRLAEKGANASAIKSQAHSDIRSALRDTLSGGVAGDR